MRVLHIISSGGMYGAEAVILNMSRTLNDGPHRSTLGVFLNSSNPNLQLHESATREGIESHLIPCTGRLDRTAIRRIRELAAQTGADVVHAHGYKADLYVYFALRGSNLPLVSTCHTWYNHDPKDRFFGIVDRFVLRSYGNIVAVSEGVRQDLLGAGVRADKISMIQNGIDLRAFDRASAVVKAELGLNDHSLVGLVGRLSSEKGVDIFLTAAARVLNQLPDAKFVVVGDGPDRANLEALIDELGIRGSVRMLGRRDDMPAVYASLDVMVSSSRREGLPIAILEGMASRLPLIATPVGAVPTVIFDGHTGVLVRAEDPELLATKIIELLQDDSQRERLGSAARKLVEEQFSAQRMTADYLNVYEAATVKAAKSRTRWWKSSVDPRGNSK
ncbi:GT4 family glycosyltransferase PelF [Granulicella sp. L46]|uniref:GT4 family glycosyltransferase PelF n=1 Tax=Granulicella sp. L46 TaxID=1641865 RepID=UPI00131D971C|nr:GT4 family glycosyltransferase PelF [Granulicella sp. L46]